MIKYMTGVPNILIKKVEVERETDKSVWVNGERRSKQAFKMKYWDTFNEAQQYLAKQAVQNLFNAAQAYKVALEKHEEIRSLKEGE